MNKQQLINYTNQIDDTFEEIIDNLEEILQTNLTQEKLLSICEEKAYAIGIKTYNAIIHILLTSDNQEGVKEFGYNALHKKLYEDYLKEKNKKSTDTVQTETTQKENEESKIFTELLNTLKKEHPELFKKLCKVSGVKNAEKNKKES